MLSTHRVDVIRMRVPLQTPATADVTVVSSPPKDQRAEKGRNERDVGERPADEVVTAVRGPMDQVMQARGNEHADGVNSPSSDPTLAHSAFANANVDEPVSSACIPEEPDV